MGGEEAAGLVAGQREGAEVGGCSLADRGMHNTAACAAEVAEAEVRSARISLFLRII